MHSSNMYQRGAFVYSEQEQMAANQTTTPDQTVDGETSNVMGSVIFCYTAFC